MSNALTTNMKKLVTNNKNIYDVVYNGINHNHRKQIAEFVASEVKTVKQFIKTDFGFCGELSFAKRMAIDELQIKLDKYMNKIKAEPVAKKKKVAKKVAKKKAVAKKKTKESLKDKYTKLYKIVSNYSENLMQDVYSVVYRKKELKRFINENLANNFIEQEVLVKLNEHAINTAKKSRALKAELEAEFA